VEPIGIAAVAVTASIQIIGITILGKMLHKMPRVTPSTEDERILIEFGRRRLAELRGISKRDR
jgi:hypothetical protein